MNTDSNTLPHFRPFPVVTGDADARPGQYGQSAYKNQQKEQKEVIERLGQMAGIDPHTISSTANPGLSFVRYTPKDTVVDKKLTHNGRANLLGYADAFLKTHDTNHDGLLTSKDIHDTLAKEQSHTLESVDFMLEHPKLSEDKRQELEKARNELLQDIEENARRWVSTMDLSDKQGNSDHKITREELAAHFYTQDTVVASLKRAKNSAKTEAAESSAGISPKRLQFFATVGIGVAHGLQKLVGRPGLSSDGVIAPSEWFVAQGWGKLLPKSYKQAAQTNFQKLGFGEHTAI